MLDSGKITDFKQLDVWQVGRKLAVAVYTATASFPNHERYGLAGQMQRAAVSIPSNIAEGYGRGSRPQYLHALQIARGSLAELETQFIIAQYLALIKDAQSLRELISMEYRLLHGLIRSLTSNTKPS
ncbi:MAG: four helix bundle protein [Armatimonadia bacterium]